VNTAEDLVQAFVGVWNERDPARRGEMVRALWLPDGRHLMGAQDVRGHGALEARRECERPAMMRISATVADHRLFQPATAGQAAGFGVAHDATLARLLWPAWDSR